MLSLQEKLQQIPWESLHHAYGTAQDTPTWLLALLSDQEEQWDEAQRKLWASICHQGSVYEASCAAVPFLIEILAQVPESRKPEILSLLGRLAHVSWYANKNHRTLRIRRSHQQWHSWGEFLTVGNDYHDPHWMKQAHQLVGEGIDAYLSLLQSPEKAVVRETLDLLAGFQEQNELLVPAIAPLAFEKTETTIQIAALRCLGALLEPQSPYWDHYQQLTLASEVQPEVCIAATDALIWHHPSGVSRRTIGPLLASVLPPQPCSALREVCKALSHLGIPYGFQGLIDVIDQGAVQWSILDTVRVAEALLDVAFFGSWVQERYWYRATPKPLNWMLLPSDKQDDSAPESRSSEQQKGHPPTNRTLPDQEDGTVSCFGRNYTTGSAFGDFTIGCFGYDNKETQRLQQLFAQGGSGALSEAQLLAIETLLHCEPLWQVKHNLAAIYGLPTTKPELEAFLKGK